MRKILVILLFLKVLSGSIYATSAEQDSLFSKISSLSDRYLTYRCSNADDSVIKICQDISNQAIRDKDYLTKFKAERLAVNALCLQGDIERGIDFAKKMYQEAQELNHPLGKALALQSMGAAYMYAGQYQQALISFSEAKPLIRREKDTISVAKLITQQLHTCTKLEDTVQIASYLSELQQLTASLPPETQNIYSFYAICYQTLLYIQTNQTEKARQNLQKVLESMPDAQYLNIWRYHVQAAFYQMTEESQKALPFLDSIIQTIKVYKHTNEYKNTIYEKAYLLEKIQDYPEACDMYLLADSLTNILNMQRYSKQIEQLHLTYHVDQVAIENAKMRNELLTNILLCSIIGIIIAILLFIMGVRRNRKLEASRKKLNEIRNITAESIQSKSIFLSNMSHDIRTPLNAIVGFSDILTMPGDTDPELKLQCRENIKQNSDLLMKLVNDIVDFSTLKEAKIKFNFEKCNVIALCRNVIDTISNVKKTEAEVTFFTTIEKLEIETDSGRLQQVLINLLTNAAKFTKAGSIHLKLDLDTQTNEAVFVVEDTGCGIPLEKQARIFERFEKLHESVQGVGLGLSICKLIVEHVNGRIWIDSTYTQGAKFVFTHPLSHIQKQSGV